MVRTRRGLATVGAFVIIRDRHSKDQMHKVTVRLANNSDIAAFSTPAGVVAPTIKGWVGEVDGERVALGGFALVHGRYMAFLDVTDEGRQLLKTSLHVRKALIRTARMAMHEARKQGIRFAYAEAEMRFPLADKMLERIGFQPDHRSENLYRWKP